MAITIAAATSKFLDMVWQDYRGQTLRKHIQLDGGITDANVIGILTSMDAMSNAIFSAELVTRRSVAGQKTPAVNALERNISEIMEYAFLTTNANGKLLTRTVLIPAMLANIENIDGSPDLVTNGSVAAFQTLLEGGLQYLNSAGVLINGGFVMSAADSHHITTPDIVNTVT